MLIKECSVNRKVKAFDLNGVICIKTGEKKYVTLYPIIQNVISKQVVDNALEELAKTLETTVRITSESEWDEFIQACKEQQSLFYIEERYRLKEKTIINWVDSKSVVLLKGNSKTYSIWEDVYKSGNIIFATIEIP